MKIVTMLMLLSGAVYAHDEDLLLCRAIQDAASRLSCYDSHVIGSGATTALLTKSTGEKVVLLVDRFGLENQRDSAEPETIATTIPGYFSGWRPNTQILMGNGQVWQISDDSSSMLDLENPKVLIRRGMVGAFFLDFEGSNRSPKVRRLK